MKISIIAATARNRALGFQNTIPWHLKEDLQHFKAKTINKPIIMGYNTYLSLPKLLPQRQNIILTSKNIQIDGAIIVHSIDEALQACNDDEIMIIGGTSIYQQFLPIAHKIYLTQIELECQFDTQFPHIPSDFKLISQECFESAYKYCFEEYERA
jgi:dihydrofolate reductase